MLISFCIPTLNRPSLLIRAIASIIDGKIDSSLFEICISNNNSNVSYLEVEKYISSINYNINIKYIFHNHRLSLDKNHLFVTEMASGEYVYFLGDDDEFISQELSLLFDYVTKKLPDLAVFSGLIIDRHGNKRESKLKRNLSFINAISAFDLLYDKLSFGAILVRKEYLKRENFDYLEGTYHAYGSFLIEILRKSKYLPKILIEVPRFKLVRLCSGEKSYNLVDVHYKRVPIFWRKLKYLFKDVDDEVIKIISEKSELSKRKLKSSIFIFRIFLKGVPDNYKLIYSTSRNKFFILKVELLKKISSSKAFKTIIISFFEHIYYVYLKQKDS